MSDIGFQGVKFGIKWLICILRASYRGRIGKVCKWAWLVALTDGFDFQTFATSAGKFYNFQFFKCNKNENYPHTKLASLLLNNFQAGHLLKIQQKKYSFDLKWQK